MISTHEQALAEGYAAVLKQTSDCARAVRDGEWSYLAACARSLEQAARNLAAAADLASRKGLRPAAADEVLALAVQASESEAAQALHPSRRLRVATVHYAADRLRAPDRLLA